MEKDTKRKRKRAENNRRVKEKGAVEEEEREVAVPPPPPTEAEVDEFFAILKRIHVAIRYFENTSARNNSSHSSGQDQKLTASEEEVYGVKVGEKKVENGGLDLNTIPEPETNI
ncbi:protein NIM1-INTERACTING 2-like [Olea europaea var. sylvestris]|uniref:Uncharacterized protein n=1 Tax=Olea europaea subsp. europaea TaxID=158383 RepID=A0A8S0QNB3_OLEEU|nr:protein NIM1-INTERACTING 2-like [Olea europaea var. sylvestris]CAA2970696.1 Hypothetical predicted protein [Olea europaea subsp. europaea]